MFSSTGKGFHITFDNGWTVSVQYGYGNYCSNNELECILIDSEAPACPDAEIAAWDKDNVWYEFESDTVKGSVTPKELLTFMNMIEAKE